MLLLSYQLVYSQNVSGPTPVNPNSSHTYSFHNGTIILYPSWVVTGGTIIHTADEGGTYYYVQVLWGAAGTGNVAFKSKVRIPLGDMDVTIEVGGPTEPPTPDTVLSNENYIHTISPAIGVTDISLLSNDEIMESVTYFDGLGRSKQNIAIKASPDKKDIITHAEYDAFGRQAKDWLPYNDTIGDLGSYRGDISFDTQQYYELNYVNDFVGVTQTIDINAFSEKEIEPSPLNRVLKQAAPGKDWKLGNGHEIKYEYETNASTEVKNFGVTLNFIDSIYIPTLVLNSTTGDYYQGNKLYKNIVKDENWELSDGNNHTTDEFKDKHGRVLLKRTYESNIAHDTYYVYDDYGNLTYVLPPKMDASTSILDTIINNLDILAYQYRYDRRNRLAEKKIPGKGLEYIVYNILDKPILTKDAVLDGQGKWLFTKYDAYGRVAYTGLISNTGSRATLQQAANAANSQHVTKNDTSTSIAGTTIYYDNGAYPTSISELHTINYYDNYTFDKVSGNSETSYGITPITNVKGLSTGSKIRVLGSSPVKWITTVSYYDTKSRPIYMYSFNDFLSTTDKVKSKLDFIGNVEETTVTHARSSFDTITTVDIFDYDHMGRLTEQTQTIDGSTKEVIAQNTYDKLGLLMAKGVGGATTQVRLQTVDYTYNVRGWLKQINDLNNIGSDLFAFNLKYNDIADVNKRLYNGNISQTLWKTANTDSSLKDYEYTYDALNRITSGIDDTGNYNLTSVAYDKNGNITDLERKGHTNVGATSFGVMDNLVYTYETNSNKLKKVLDNGNDTFGFKDGANLTTEYTYDTNGNLLTDANKGITSISYNHLNMPTEIKFDNSNTKKINYVYAADRTKLRKTTNDNGSITTTDYSGNFVYENNTLKQFYHAEGYVEPDGSSFQYVYQLKDIWRNVRITYADDDNSGSVNSSEIRREQNYYPFGLEHQGYNSYKYGVENNLKTYQSQEFTADLDLNTHEWKFRMSDPSLGRFWQIDPLAEDYTYNSTYAFQENKLGMGTELEGKELDMFYLANKVVGTYINLTGGVKKVQQGTVDHVTSGIPRSNSELNNNDKYTDAVKSRQTEALNTISQGINQISDKIPEVPTLRDVANTAEVTGDLMVVGSPIIGPAAPLAAGAGAVLSTGGTILNVGLDVVEGEYKSAAKRVVIEAVSGGLSSLARNAPGVDETAEQIIDAHIIFYENVVIPMIENKQE